MRSVAIVAVLSLFVLASANIFAAGPVQGPDQKGAGYAAAQKGIDGGAAQKGYDGAAQKGLFGGGPGQKGAVFQKPCQKDGFGGGKYGAAQKPWQHPVQK